MTKAPTVVMPEFSREVPIEAIPEDGKEYNLKATADECAAIAARFELDMLSSFELNADIRPFNNGVHRGLVVTMKLQASFEQSCIVTSDPVPGMVNDTVVVRLIPQKQYDALYSEDGEELLFSTEDADYEVLPSGKLDLGELATQYLGLAIPLYPRVDNVVAKDVSDKIVDEKDLAEEKARNNPFAILSELKHNS